MRKTERFPIPAPAPGERPNRDAGKVFILTEMPARRAEKFAVRLMQALGSSGVEVPQQFEALGMIGVFLMAYQTLMGSSFEQLGPLMDEMLTECVKVETESGVTRDIMNERYDDFEEVETIVIVRKKLIELHAGFTFADVISKLKASAPRKKRSTYRTT